MALKKKASKKAPREQWVTITEDHKIRVGVNEFKGIFRLDVREWISTDSYEGFTKKGVSVRVEQADELLDAITKVVAVIKAEGLSNEAEEDEEE